MCLYCTIRVNKGQDLATIFNRINKDGSVSYRVMIRRKGLPLLTLSFFSYAEAVNWVIENEEKYIDNPNRYQKWIKKERLNLERDREFKRSKAKKVLS
jgi:hypothetical protein